MHVTFETRKSNAGVTFLSEDKNNKLKILSLNGHDLTEVGEVASGRYNSETIQNHIVINVKYFNSKLIKEDSIIYMGLFQDQITPSGLSNQYYLRQLYQNLTCKNGVVSGAHHMSDEDIYYDMEQFRLGGETKQTHKYYLWFASEENFGKVVNKLRFLSKIEKAIRKYAHILKQIAYSEKGSIKLINAFDVIKKADWNTGEFKAFYNTVLNNPNEYKDALSIIDFIQNKGIGEALPNKTQEEMIDTLLKLAKTKANKKIELVNYRDIKTIKKSRAYQSSVRALLEKGFKLSKTQQFNIQQQIGIFAKQKGNTMFNLSDMGSGKTLMTVQSIVVLNNLLLESKNLTPEYKAYLSENNITINLPNTYIIAPTLSLKSSWLETFKMFYDVEKVDDFHYTYKTNHNKVKAIGHIYMSGFSVTNTLRVKQRIANTLYETLDDYYLIFDEIHQVLDKPVKLSKFFDFHELKGNGVKFILSGTLANLKPRQWYHYLALMNETQVIKPLEGSPADREREAESVLSDLNRSVRDTIQNSRELLHRELTMDTVENNIKIASQNLKKKEDYVSNIYDTKVLASDSDTYDINNPLVRRYFQVQDDVTSAPNIELFYKIVGKNAVTAESSTIAFELFGEQPEQLQSDVIRVPNNLTPDELDILSTVHTIIHESNKYNSAQFATKLQNAILNLNDGLSDESLYQMINKCAVKNKKFREYILELSTDFLKKLSESRFIHNPELTETDKFKTLQDILDINALETTLIVVNDANGMAKLSKALGLKHFTKTELATPMAYQETIDKMFAKQNVVVVPQFMIKSSLDLVQANRIVQYQLNNDIEDIIQSQNRINRIGQTRDTKAYYIATDQLQNVLINIFLDTYQNIRIAHKGIVEMFMDINSQVNIINDYFGQALKTVKDEVTQNQTESEVTTSEPTSIEFQVA